MLRILSAALLALLLAVPAAEAAKRAVPQGWLGVTADGPLSPADVAEWDLMTGAGVETVRVAFSWRAIQPAPGGPLDFSSSDALVAAAVTRGMGVLPVVEFAPDWAAVRPGDLAAPPSDLAAVQAFLTAVVQRYGPAGSLWAERPDLPRRPIRVWQVWNEPNHTGFWNATPYAPSYVATLRAAAAGIRAADAAATVLLGGLTNTSWIALRQLYDAGAHGAFDAVALHPYTRRPKDVVRLVRLSRGVMRKHGDGGLPIWITELSWPAAKGKPVPRPIGIEVNERGQQWRLAVALRQLARIRVRQRIGGVFWYTWLSTEAGANPFDWAGLRRDRAGTRSSAPALGTFRHVARRLEGCAKVRGDARRCAK